jgi:hypothetical protein
MHILREVARMARGAVGLTLAARTGDHAAGFVGSIRHVRSVLDLDDAKRGAMRVDTSGRSMRSGARGMNRPADPAAPARHGLPGRATPDPRTATRSLHGAPATP